MRTRWLPIFLATLGCDAHKPDTGAAAPRSPGEPASAGASAPATTPAAPESTTEPQAPAGPKPPLLPVDAELRLLPWYGADGRDITARLTDEPCVHPDNFTGLRQGNLLWSACNPGKLFPGGTLIAIDLDAGRIDAAWPFPASAALQELIGVAQLPDGRLGVVHASTGRDGRRIAAAITGPRGWTLTPTPLGAYHKVLGVMAVDAALELAVRPDEKSCAVKVLRISPSAPRTERSLDLTNPSPDADELTSAEVVAAVIAAETGGKPPPPLFCHAPAFAYRRPGEPAWRFVGDDPKRTWDLVEGGRPATVPGPPGERHQAVDLVTEVSGLLPSPTRPAHTDLRFSAGGAVVPHIRPPAGVREASHWHLRRFEFRDGYLHSPCAWETEDPPTTLQRVEGRDLSLGRARGGQLALRDLSQSPVTEVPLAWVPPSGDLAADLANTLEDEFRRENPGLKLPGKQLRRCRDLTAPFFVPREAGGLWLTNADGCHLAIAPKP